MYCHILQKDHSEACYASANGHSRSASVDWVSFHHTGDGTGDPGKPRYIYIRRCVSGCVCGRDLGGGGLKCKHLARCGACLQCQNLGGRDEVHYMFEASLVSTSSRLAGL